MVEEKQSMIDDRLLQNARDLIPNMIEFKLTYVLNGSKTENLSNSNEVYIPAKLQALMNKLELSKNEAIHKNLQQHSLQAMEDDEVEQEDYVLPSGDKKRSKIANDSGSTRNAKTLKAQDLYAKGNINMWDDSDDDEGDGKYKQTQAVKHIKEMRAKLEKAQAKDQKVVKREKDEWDVAYDKGKEKKIKTKSFKAFEEQNLMFQQSYEEKKYKKEQWNNNMIGLYEQNDQGGDSRGGFRGGFRGGRGNSGFRGGRGRGNSFGRGRGNSFSGGRGGNGFSGGRGGSFNKFDKQPRQRDTYQGDRKRDDKFDHKKKSKKIY